MPQLPLKSRVIAALCLVLSALASAAEPRRLALVVGNARYQHAPVLDNAANDGRDMSESLRSLGFTVVAVMDAGLSAFDRSLDAFRAQVRPGDIVVVFYAGHGVMGLAAADTEAFDNFLIPTDALLAAPEAVPVETIGLQKIMGALDAAGAGPRVVVLDACRDNPFGEGWPRTADGRRTRGMVQPASASLDNVYIAFATSPGSTASDNSDGRNGLFTQELLKSLQLPGLTITAVMERASASVEYLSQGMQRPWFAAGGGEAANLVMHEAPGAPRAIADSMTLDLRLAREAFDCGLPVCLESTAAGVRSVALRQELLASAAASRAAARAGAPVPAQPLPAPPPLPSTQPSAALVFIRAHLATLDGWVEIADRLMSGADGFHRDEAEALQWYRAAALAGSGRAAFDVGSAYHRGVGGIPADPAQALAWFKRSADAGYPQAYGMLGEYDGARAALWFRRGRDLGDAASARRLADLTFSGTGGLQKDPAAAQRLYLEAARLGDAEAMYRVSSFIVMSRTRPDPVLVGDDDTAMGWLLKSAELGHLPSYLQLALDYHLGQNTRRDDVQALQWLLRAAERGSKEAMVTVGVSYATGGYGLTRDCHQAGRWLRRAQVAGSRDALLELFSVAPKCESYS